MHVVHVLADNMRVPFTALLIRAFKIERRAQIPPSTDVGMLDAKLFIELSRHCAKRTELVAISIPPLGNPQNSESSLVTKSTLLFASSVTTATTVDLQ